MSDNVEVKGMAEAVAMLEHLGKRGGRNAVTRSTRKAARGLVKLTRTIAPKRTGLLRRSIRLSSVKYDRDTGTIRASVKAKTTKGQKKKSGRDAFYHKFVAQGTKYIRGQMFYDKAARRGFRRYVSDFENALPAEIDKEKAKIATRK